MNRQIWAFWVICHFGLSSGPNYNPSTSCKIWDKSNELILRKKAAIMSEQINDTILSLFDLFLHKQEFFQKNWLP